MRSEEAEPGGARGVADRVFAALSWQANLDLVGPLLTHLESEAPIAFTADAAIAFDANVFLHLGRGGQAEDFIDYFSTQHKGPLVVPTQALLELWNNHVAELGSVGDLLTQKTRELSEVVDRIEPEYAGLREGAEQILEAFQDEYGHVLNGTARGMVAQFLEMLQGRAVFSHADRSRFAPVAANRKRTRTAPGFKDPGDGDFFVWADLLHGLCVAREAGHSFSAAILVTDDRKKDWSTKGRAHPVLFAELWSIFQVPFGVLTLEQVKQHVKTVSGRST